MIRGPIHRRDYVEGVGYAKLYVAAVPITAIEDDIRPLFEEYGNVIEVVFLRDKRTGQQQECCFVKYTTSEEAEKAIGALHNQYTLPGGQAPIKVRYADREKPRFGNNPTPVNTGGDRNFFGGTPEPKLYVSGLNKSAWSQEVEEIFSLYGYVEDVFILLDEWKHSRGCGFVRFSHMDMAVAAINALNGVYVMKGCDQPLIVRFADPKKPRIGDSRGNFAFGGTDFAFHSQEPDVRPAAFHGELNNGHFLPTAMHQSNAYTPVQQISSRSQQEAISPIAKPLQQEHSNSHEGSESSAIAVSHKQSHHSQPFVEDSMQLEISQSLAEQSPCLGSENPTNVTFMDALEETAVSTMSASSALPANNQTEDPPDCDWSEHTCPDGYKYYYNCVTYESRWEKPEELSLYEQSMKQRPLPNSSCQQLHTHKPKQHSLSPEVLVE